MRGEVEARARVGRVALEYLGTPFHDNGEVKGAGVDCATFLKRAFEEAGVVAPFKLDHYSPQFFLHQSEERYIGWVERVGGREIAQDEAKPGDIALFKIGLCFAHGALIIEPGWPHIVHAHSGYKRVIRGDGNRPLLGTRVLGLKFFSLWT